MIKKSICPLPSLHLSNQSLCRLAEPAQTAKCLLHLLLVQGGVQDTCPARAKEAHTGCRRLCSAHRGPPAHHLRWSSWADAPNLDQAAPSHPLADSLHLPRPPPLLLYNHPTARSCAQAAAHRQGAHRAGTSSSDGTQAATVLLRLRLGVPGFPIHAASLPTSQT